MSEPICQLGQMEMEMGSKVKAAFLLELEYPSLSLLVFLEPVSASIGITKTKALVATAGRSLSPSALAYSHSQLLSLLLLLPLLLIPVQLARSVEAIQNVKECKRTGQTTMKTKRITQQKK